MNNPSNVAEYVRSFEARGDIRLFYRTWIWQKKAEQIRIRDRHRCVRCWQNGIYDGSGRLIGFYREGKLVHHKKHLRKHPELALDDNNLETLCEECHMKEHPELYPAKVKFPERWD